MRCPHCSRYAGNCECPARTAHMRQAPQPQSVDYPSILERERSAVAAGVASIRKAMASREHLREPGRGTFAYDDEQYQREFGDALDEIDAALAPLSAIARDRSNCPTDPASIKAARAPQPQAGMAVAIKALEEALPLSDPHRRIESPRHNLDAVHALVAEALRKLEEA